MTPPRSFYLAMDARLAAMAADIATMRAQLAPWIELPATEPVAVPSAAASGSVSPRSGGLGSPGASAKDRIADATNSESGARACRAAETSSPADPPVTRPPAKAPAKPAGISLRKRLLDFLALHAETGKALPTDAEIAKQLGTTRDHISSETLRLKRANGITFGGKRLARIVTFPGVQRAPETSTYDDRAKANPPPAPPARKPTADQAEIERYLATKGVTRLPTAFADVSTGSSTADERAAIARHREEQEARRREEINARNRRANGQAEPLTKARA